jgi:hypothetical protein
MGYSDNVKFEPFCGGFYNAHETKVLCLGESHYGSGTEGLHFTKNVIESYYNIDNNWRFFNGILRTIWGTTDGKKDKLQHIAFYNYVQEIVGKNPRNRPSNQAWKDAEVPFREVISKLQPKIIICFGKGLYYNLPKGGTLSESQLFSKQWSEAWKYDFGGYGIEVIGLFHPASPHGFNATDYFDGFRLLPWHKQFLAESRQFK